MASTDSTLKSKAKAEAEKVQSGEGGLARTLKDLFAGAAGGVAQVLLGESLLPFNHLMCFEKEKIKIKNGGLS